MLQSRETVWWFLLKCQIQGLFPLRDPQVNLQHFVFQPAKDWPGLWALAPHSLFFVCLDWLIQVTTCYFLSKYCGWIFFFPPNGTDLLSPCCVSSWKLCTGREPLVAELGWWPWPWLWFGLSWEGFERSHEDSMAVSHGVAGALVSWNNSCGSSSDLVAVAGWAFIDAPTLPVTCVIAFKLAVVPWAKLHLSAPFYR